MATKKSKSSTKSMNKTKVTSSKTTAEEKIEMTAKEVKKDWKTIFKGFFGRKYETNESINTVFKTPSFYGALLGEVLGTMLVGLMMFAIWPLGMGNLTYVASYIFAVIAIYIAVVAFSGACLNPTIAVGMMATRRMSVVRGVMYIIAEIVGVWLAWLIFNGCHLAAVESAVEGAAMTAIAEGGFWMVALIEFMGAGLLGFFFARALEYRRSVFTFASTIAGGMVLAILVGYVLSAAYFSLRGNFIYNPAVALMMQIFPTAGESFGEVLGGICQALSAYVVIPMIGGVVGFYISDFVKRLADE